MVKLRGWRRRFEAPELPGARKRTGFALDRTDRGPSALNNETYIQLDDGSFAGIVTRIDINAAYCPDQARYTRLIEAKQ